MFSLRHEAFERILIGSRDKAIGGNRDSPRLYQAAFTADQFFNSL